MRSEQLTLVPSEIEIFLHIDALTVVRCDSLSWRAFVKFTATEPQKIDLPPSLQRSSKLSLLPTQIDH